MEIKYKKIYILLLFSFLLSSCDSLNLGKKLVLWGDNEKYYEIVLCSNNEFLFGCMSGTHIIPPDKFSRDNFSEYVEKYVKNNKWVIVRTNYIKYGKQTHEIQLPVDTTYQRYWAIDKSYNEKTVDANIIINSYLIGPLDSVAFYNFLHEKKLVSLWEK